ncbi:cytochrome P450 [Promicromonospora sukumoe]|uniref:cytochrome P450 n=1 Tax=Promicromonospora sukumoe TaxID=88382 RepID=UPI000375D5F3|nr:cytochrome P450 [Promicromonospora sukumoe]
MNPQTARHVATLEEHRGLTSLTEITSSPDPQAHYARLRAQWGEVAPVEIERKDDVVVPAWLVLGHAENCHVMRSEVDYSRNAANWRWNRENLLPAGTAIGTFAPPAPRPTSFYHDGPERERLRAPLDDALAALDERAVRDQTRYMCERVIERMGDSGSGDLVKVYSRPVGFLAMTTTLGFDLETGARLMADSAAVVSGDGEQVAKAQASTAAIVMEHIGQRRQDGGQDLIGHLVGHPNFAHDGEIATSAIVPVSAAAIFLTAWITQTLHQLLADRELSARMSGGRLTLDGTLDQVLWRRSPIAQSPALRYARNDVQLGGRSIRKGDALVLAIAAANADPAVHTDDLWDEVDNRSHLSWGTGPHACPAPRLARLIARTAVDHLLRHRDVQLTVPESSLPAAASPWVRHAEKLPVTWQRATDRGAFR